MGTNKIPSRQRQEAELRLRIAKHLSGRVRPSAATTSISDNQAGRCIFCIIWSLRRSVSEIKSRIDHKCTDAVTRVGAFSVFYGQDEILIQDKTDGSACGDVKML